MCKENSAQQSVSVYELSCEYIGISICPDVAIPEPVQWTPAAEGGDVGCWKGPVTTSGNFTVTGIDANNVSHTYTVTVPQLPSLDVVNPSCGGTEGSICFSPGALAVTDIVWSTSETSMCIDDLAAGFYYVQFLANVFDQWVPGFCGAQLIGPLEVDITFSDIEFHCSGSTGDLIAVVSGGSGIYEFEWNGPNIGMLSDNPTSFSTTNQTPTYTVTVSDPISGCEGSATVTIDLLYYGCGADLDDSGAVNTYDLLLFMGYFGGTGNDGDFDCDGTTNVNDLLVFFQYFGTQCPE